MVARNRARLSVCQQKLLELCILGQRIRKPCRVRLPPMLCGTAPYCTASPGSQIRELTRVMLSKYVPIGLGGKQAMPNKLPCAQISDTCMH